MNLDEKLKKLNIQKDKRYNLGKRVGDHVWFEKRYVLDIMTKSDLKELDDILNSSLENKEIEHIKKSKIIRYSPKDKTVAYIKSDDFDEKEEPTVGDSLLINLKDKTIKTTPQNKNPLIYHHKWLMVKDDYDGFNIKKSKERSILWKSKLGTNKELSSKIGRKNFWDKWLEQNGLLERIWDYSGIVQGLTSAKTSINNKLISKGFTLAIKNQIFKNNSINLDIGGGAFDNATKALKEIGTTNYIYDPHNRTPEHNKLVIKSVQNGQADTVTCHNVLNVIKEDTIKEKIIKQAKNALKDDGIFMITVYEGDKKNQEIGPRKTGNDQWQEFKKIEEYLPIIEKHFDNIIIKNKMIICSKNESMNLNNIFKQKNTKKAKL